MKSNKVLNRLKIDIIDNNDNQVFRVFQDWCKLVEMQKEINIKPNRVEFDFLPGYVFHGLKQISTEQEINTDLTVKFECDFIGKLLDDTNTNFVHGNEMPASDINNDTFDFVCKKINNKLR